ncbi:hypothetical protein [Xanthomonas bundabergensis]|uniref:hypothetical protein n=1 Tax=Xanthomonas bundabergensis TaxID=3160842 RepID=UPI003512F061
MLLVSACGGHDRLEDSNLYKKLRSMDEQGKLKICENLPAEEKASLFFLTMRRHHGDYSLDDCFANSGLDFIYTLKSMIKQRGLEQDVLHLIVIVASMKKDELISREDVVNLDLKSLCKIKVPHGLGVCYRMVHEIGCSGGENAGIRVGGSINKCQ